MKIEKFKNSYRVRKTYKNKTYCLYFGEKKPTQTEIAIALAKKIEECNGNAAPGTVKDYTNRYIDALRKEGKSTTTLNAYNSILNNTPDWFLKTELDKVTSSVMQKVIDEYSEKHSPKSTANFNGLYRCVLASFCPDRVISVKLPKREKKIEYEPSTKDIQAILKYAKGSRYELFLRLASIGLRRGEAAAITVADLSKDNVLTIDKDMVLDENNKYIIKDHPKTSASYRRILIPSDTADLLRKQEKVFDGNLHTINEYLHKVQDALKIPRFRLHIMRHFAAAYLVKNGFTKNQVLEYCGWEKGSSVMEKVYSYNLDPEESQKDIASVFNNLT